MHPQGQLRILETTDLHMHLLGHDYFTDQADPAIGLAPLADVISARRGDGGVTTLLFDNGDFLQGTPLADTLAMQVHDGAAHAMARAFNRLGYDAVTLGNHEFDYGAAALAAFADQLDCPVVSANVAAGPAADDWTPYTILLRRIICNDGVTRPIRIGVTGFAPPSLTQAHGVSVVPIAEAANRHVPDVRRAGADLVIALCHVGPGDAHTTLPESATTIAAIDGIDLLLLGHVHDIFPDPRRASDAAICHESGTILGKPAVMAGYHGNHLGEIDLTLEYARNGWRVIDHAVRLHRNGQTQLPQSVERSDIAALTAPAHDTAQQHMRQIIGHAGQRLHNHFATVFPDPVAWLFADVMQKTVSAKARVPCLIAAVAPFQPAGARGIGQRIDLPAGALTRLDATRLFPFNDRLCAIRRTGRQLRDWLERSAARYATVSDAQGTPALILAESAGYQCDGLFGLTYNIDLSAGAESDFSGQPRPETEGRVRNIRLDGQPVSDDLTYCVATTDFRAGGGGGFPVIPDTDRLWTSDESLRDVLIDAIAAGAASQCAPRHVWQFRAPAGAAVWIGGDPGVSDLAPVALEPHELPDGRSGYLLHF